MPIQGIQTKLKFGFSAWATESHQLYHEGRGRGGTSGQLKITQGSGVWHASLSSRVEPCFPKECSGNSNSHTSQPRRLRNSRVPQRALYYPDNDCSNTSLTRQISSQPDSSPTPSLGSEGLLGLSSLRQEGRVHPCRKNPPPHGGGSHRMHGS